MLGYGGFQVSLPNPAYKPEMGKLWLENGAASSSRPISAAAASSARPGTRRP